MELVYFFVLYLTLTLAALTESNPKALSRRKRYIVFPSGSAFSIQFCMSTKTLTDDDIYTAGMNFQTGWDLPNKTIRGLGYDLLFNIPQQAEKRRDRRDVYSNMEIIFNSIGIDGRACMLRTVCEASQRLIPRKSLVTELFRIIFTLPLELVGIHEPADVHLYDAAHRKGLADHDCTAMFPNCPMSFLDLAFR